MPNNIVVAVESAQAKHRANNMEKKLSDEQNRTRLYNRIIDKLIKNVKKENINESNQVRVLMRVRGQYSTLCDNDKVKNDLNALLEKHTEGNVLLINTLYIDYDSDIIPSDCCFGPNQGVACSCCICCPCLFFPFFIYKSFFGTQVLFTFNIKLTTDNISSCYS